MTKVLQRGLYTRTQAAMELFADRVSEYNKSKGFIVVEMEGREVDGDDIYPAPHYKVDLEFKSREYCKDFWTDPAFQSNIKPAQEGDI